MGLHDVKYVNLGEVSTFSGFKEYLLIATFYTASGGITSGSALASINTISGAKYDLITDMPSSTTRGVLKIYRIIPMNQSDTVIVSMYACDLFTVVGLQ